jgi:molecular chaperone GrpE
MNKDRESGRRNTSSNKEAERIRVTDRRRIHLDGNGKEGSQAAEPSLKPSYVEELEARAKAAEQKLFEVQSRFDQLRAQLQRETDETRQRLNRAADERTQREKAAFIAALLPVVDNLQRAIDAAESGSSLEAIVDGVKGTANSFEAALAATGVEPIASVGEPFNPEMHEAVDTTAVEPEREGQVTAEYARGYRIGDRLLRPARVQVGRAKADAKGAIE